MLSRSILRVRIIQAYSYSRPNLSTRTPRWQSTKSSDYVDVEALLKEPTWSVKSLFEPKEDSQSTLAITKEQLHHLLRLSALPPPKSEQEEAKMIKDLQAQLQFVQAIQEVDTEGVEPLQAIRDETEEARKRDTITMESLKHEFEKEEVVGKRGRIRKRKTVEKEEAAEEEKKWNPLAHTTKTRGPFFVVDTAKD